MKIKSVSISNFRLLEDIHINIEDDITLIVGKNNSGKTSLFEVINLFTAEKNNFSFHDFSKAVYSTFEECYKIFRASQNEPDEERKKELEGELIKQIPRIELIINVEYDKLGDSLTNLAEFISDLDDNRHDGTITVRYEPTKSEGLFRAYENRKDKKQRLIPWMEDNISSHYRIRGYGGGNQIDENFRRKLQAVVCFETIQASRKLDDTKGDKNRTLAVGFSDYYREANKDNDSDVEGLELQLKETSKDLNKKYEAILKEVLLRLKNFGVEPHVSIPEIVLQAGFDPESILKNNIKFYYRQDDITLPENYNGLGYSNLIYLVLKVVSFIEKFKKAGAGDKSEILAILIEEPEAHLHPQMQQVFISQIKQMIRKARMDDGLAPQVIISTHSSHIVAEAGIDVERSFERIRYFSKVPYKEQNRVKLQVKDFNEFKCSSDDRQTFRFLKQYMSLHKCDIFFADKIIFVEGSTERLLLPQMINKVAPSLNNEYLSIIEAGGAFANKFKEILQFIGTKTLIITDLDSVDPQDKGTGCPANQSNAVTLNSTLLNWLPGKKLVSELISCPKSEKIDNEQVFVAYQINETGSEYVARSLEEAIINANLGFFAAVYEVKESRTGQEIEDGSEKEGKRKKSGERKRSVRVQDAFTCLKKKKLEQTAWELAPDGKGKTIFAFELMTFDEETTKQVWKVPAYIKEGLEWLTGDEKSVIAKPSKTKRNPK